MCHLIDVAGTAFYCAALQYKAFSVDDQSSRHQIKVRSSVSIDLSYRQQRGRPSLSLTLCLVLLRTVAALVLPQCAQAQQAIESECESEGEQSCPNNVTRSFDAVKAYASGPLHWTSTDWLYFGGAIAAVGVAHQFDSNVRRHFTGNAPSGLVANPHSLQDAIPAAALFVGTWGYAQLIDDSDGRHEASAMLEAAVLSLGPAYALKYATGRKLPNQTSDPNRWSPGSGGSFPSEHTTAAFAIGTVLAESGNGEYRWIRRFLGYGAAGFTAYERLKHNAHWLSDTVAGGALGAASASFAMHRQRGADSRDSSLALTPIAGGVVLRYQQQLPW
jgi:membrane-associated phospholipid phosphatase